MNNLVELVVVLAAKKAHPPDSDELDNGALPAGLFVFDEAVGPVTTQQVCYDEKNAICKVQLNIFNL